VAKESRAVVELAKLTEMHISNEGLVREMGPHRNL
jgi:hypothetical protein